MRVDCLPHASSTPSPSHCISDHHTDTSCSPHERSDAAIQEVRRCPLHVVLQETLHRQLEVEALRLSVAAEPVQMAQPSPMDDDLPPTVSSVTDSGPKSQMALDGLIAKATAKYAVKDYSAAAELYSQATELQAELNGEMSVQNADLLYLYGRCLYHVAVQNSDVLGTKVAGEGKRREAEKTEGGSLATKNEEESNKAYQPTRMAENHGEYSKATTSQETDLKSSKESQRGKAGDGLASTPFSTSPEMRTGTTRKTS